MRKLNIFLAVLVSLFIVACDTDDNTLLDPVPGGGGGGGSGVFLVDMGSGAGAAFIPDVITVATPILSSGDSTTIDVTLVDTLTTNTPYQNEVVAVTFTSLCLTAGTADLQVGGVSTNPISSQTGFIQATYVVQGCSGPDVITANATLADGTALTAVGTVTVSAAVDMGNGTGAAFMPDIIAVAVPNLSAGGSTGLDISIVDTANAANTLYGAEVIDVTFSSLCLAGGTADIQVLGISTNPVSTATGLLSPTYVAQGCNGADLVTAAATLADGTPLTATGTVTIAPAAVGSISFLSAVPQLIGLRGTGGQGFDETAVVKFKVVDAIGAAVVGADVTFTLSTMVGGITVLPATATSDNAVEVQTVVT